MATSRRTLLKTLSLATTGLAIAGANTALGAAASGTADSTNPPLKGNIKHSVARWTFDDLSIAELCALVKQIGFNAIDLCGPDDWPTLKQHGVYSSLCNGAELNLTDGWCDKRFHEELIQRYHRHIDLVADAGYKSLICFSGNARGIPPIQGMANAIEGLKQVLPHAEQRGITLVMELFNTKVEHPDYMACNSEWGVSLCRSLGSPNFKLLYDIYHMQIMEGDVIRTIRNNYQYFGHYQTAGVPGRHELDETQELYYPAIARAVLESGFKGYFGQEFMPTAKTKAGRAQALKQAIQLCDV